jgi:hypothetical protein
VNKYFLLAKAALSAVLAWFIPAWIPFIIAYWLGLAFIFWRGRRGPAGPEAPKVAVEYLGGYPGLAAPQTLWLTAGRGGLTSGGLRLPYEAMRRLRLLGAAEGVELARREGLAAPPGAAAGDLYLALLWRDGRGAEREILFRLPEGQGEREFARLKERVEALRLEAAGRRRGA